MLRSRLSAVLVGAFAFVAIASCDPIFEPATADSFTATLDGVSMVPNPVSTAARGSISLTLSDTILTFTATATNLTGVTSAHLHAAGIDVTGPILVQILNANNSPAGTINGTLATGTITPSSVAVGLPISFESIIALMRNGDVYFDVHTTANSSGEIRGQLIPVH